LTLLRLSIIHFWATKPLLLGIELSMLLVLLVMELLL